MDAGQDLERTINGVIDLLIDAYGYDVETAQGVLASYLEQEQVITIRGLGDRMQQAETRRD